MTHQQWLKLCAKVVAVCIAFLAIVDMGAELHLRWALRLKWSALWVIARYVGMGFTVVLVIYVLTR
jgi:hypothetical protein